MQVRAKLVCQSVNETTDSGTGEKNGEKVAFATVYDTANSPEDNNFSKYTPSASFEMYVENPDLFGKFEPRKAYYFDINEA